MNKFLKISYALLAVAGLSSCLNEDPIFNPDDSANVIEIQSVGGPIQSPPGAIHPLYVQSFDIVPEAELNVTVSYSGANVAPKDITVNLGFDTEALEKYNIDQKASYEMLPASMFSMAASTVTIPKGERSANFVIKVKPSAFDLSKAYALPLKVLESNFGIISGNHNTVIVSVGAKNKYDGVYTVTGTFVDNTNAAFSGYYPKEIELRTLDENSNVVFDATFGMYYYIFYTGTGLSYFGNWQAVLNFAPDNTIESVTNYYGQGTNSSKRSGKIIPTGVNTIKFGANGKPEKIEVSYIMVQGTTDRGVFTETYTYKGAR